MNNYLGDFDTAIDIYIVFDTADSTGLSITATVVVADIEVYKQGTGAINLVQRSSTAGFTLDVDHDAMTGTHMAAIDTSDNTDAGFYAAGNDYFVKLNTITVDGISISKWIGHFSLQNRYSAGALRPTSAGNTLDVTATGAAGIDWANIENPTTVVDLSGTDIQQVDTAVALTTNNDKAGYSISGTITTLDGLENIAATDIVSAGAITTLTGAVVNVDTTDSVTGSVASVTGAVGSVTADVGVNEWNGVALGTTNPLPNAAAGAAGGLPTDSTGKTSFNDITAANVNTEVLDVMNVDTFGEPAQGAPGATVSIFAKINYLYKVLRNKKDATSTLIQIYDDAGTTVDHKRTISDNGTTYTEEEIVTGP